MIVRRTIIHSAAKQQTIAFSEPARTCPDCGRDVPNNAAALDHHRRLAHEATGVYPVIPDCYPAPLGNII